MNFSVTEVGGRQLTTSRNEVVLVSQLIAELRNASSRRRLFVRSGLDVLEVRGCRTDPTLRIQPHIQSRGGAAAAPWIGTLTRLLDEGWNHDPDHRAVQ